MCLLFKTGRCGFLNSGQWQCAWLAAVPKWVMFHCLSVFITVFTTNLVLWCSVQLVLLWKQLSSVLRRRFPPRLAQILLWFCWCDDGSCKAVPRGATVGLDPPLAHCNSRAGSHSSIKQASQRNCFLQDMSCGDWWAFYLSSLQSRCSFNNSIWKWYIRLKLRWEVWWQNKRVVCGSLSNIELQLQRTKRKPECSKCWHVNNRRIGLNVYRYRRCDNMLWLLWKNILSSQEFLCF